KIAVTDMAYDRRQDAAFLDIALGFGDAFRQPRYRYADIGRDHRSSGAQREIRERRMMTRLPQARALLRLRGPRKRTTAEFRRDLAKALRLFGDRSLRAVEFEKQHRRLR